MARFLHSIYSCAIRKCDKLFLALSWVTGLGFGSLIFRYAGSTLASQMPLAVKCQPSIIGLLTSVMLPFLVSAFAVYIRAPWLLYGVCCLKSFGLAYVSCAVFCAFDSAGWLIRGLFMFTDICGSVALYLYWYRHISGVRSFSWRALGVYCAVVFLAARVDLCFISPMLRRCLLL